MRAMMRVGGGGMLRPRRRWWHHHGRRQTYHRTRERKKEDGAPKYSGGANAYGQRIIMCWLCAYHGEALGARLSAFIVKNIGVMDPQCIAQQVSDFLLLQVPDAEGASREIVHEHIARHMLHPRVRLAVTLRQLLDFLSLIQTSLVVNDGGACTVDKSNADLYLKVIEKVVTLYKVYSSCRERVWRVLFMTHICIRAGRHDGHDVRGRLHQRGGGGRGRAAAAERGALIMMIRKRRMAPPTRLPRGRG